MLELYEVRNKEITLTTEECGVDNWHLVGRHAPGAILNVVVGIMQPVPEWVQKALNEKLIERRK